MRLLLHLLIVLSIIKNQISAMPTLAAIKSEDDKERTKTPSAPNIVQLRRRPPTVRIQRNHSPPRAKPTLFDGLLNNYFEPPTFSADNVESASSGDANNNEMGLKEHDDVRNPLEGSASDEREDDIFQQWLGRCSQDIIAHHLFAAEAKVHEESESDGITNECSITEDNPLSTKCHQLTTTEPEDHSVQYVRYEMDDPYTDTRRHFWVDPRQYKEEVEFARFCVYLGY